jgi:hypothetical protein
MSYYVKYYKADGSEPTLTDHRGRRLDRNGFSDA